MNTFRTSHVLTEWRDELASGLTVLAKLVVPITMLFWIRSRVSM